MPLGSRHEQAASAIAAEADIGTTFRESAYRGGADLIARWRTPPNSLRIEQSPPRSIASLVSPRSDGRRQRCPSPHCPVSNVQSAPPPAFCLMTIGSIVHSSFVTLSIIEPAAPSDATPAIARVP
jgi:hypothetical protein